MLPNDDFEQKPIDLIFKYGFEQIIVDKITSKSLQVVLTNNSSKLTKWLTNLFLHKGYPKHGKALSNHYRYYLIFPTTNDKKIVAMKKKSYSKVNWIAEMNLWFNWIAEIQAKIVLIRTKHRSSLPPRITPSTS